jgi:hypothetical protein
VQRWPLETSSPGFPHSAWTGGTNAASSAGHRGRWDSEASDPGGKAMGPKDIEWAVRKIVKAIMEGRRDQAYHLTVALAHLVS